MEFVEKEVGGFSQVQKEAIAILSSPTIADDVRKEALTILQRLGAAFMADQVAEEKVKELKGEEKEKLEKGKEEAEKEKLKEKEKGPAATLKRLKTISRANSQSSSSTAVVVKAPTSPTSPASPSSPSSELQHRPTIKRAATTASSIIARMSAEGRVAHQAAKREAKEEKEVASWELLDLKPDDEPALLCSQGLLRLHGLFVGERKHFEVREKNGKLVLVDALTGSTMKE
jgi:hypothetical protein